MGLGKTLQSVSLIYTLLKTGITANGAPTAKRVIVVCPCSLVKNWANEFVKWLGPNAVKVLAISKGDRKSVERDIDCFVRTNIFRIRLPLPLNTMKPKLGKETGAYRFYWKPVSSKTQAWYKQNHCRCRKLQKKIPMSLEINCDILP